MSDLIKRSDAINAINQVGWLEDSEYESRILAIPSADRPQKKLAETLAPYTTREELIIADAESKGYAEGFKDGLEADRPQGEWVPFEYGDERWHKCTACGVADKYIEYVERPNGTTGKLVAIRNFCPNCGADMRGADDEVR